MTRFLDGPAAGKTLTLRNSPELLRVTIDRITGEVDALDAREDSPKATEALHVYKLRNIEQLNAIVCTRGKGGSRSFSKIANYVIYTVQPPQEVMQSPMDWGDWLRGEYEKLNAK